MTPGAPAPSSGGGAQGPAAKRKFVQFGRYLLLDRVAVGGMAEVYRAKAFGVEGFERIIAIKRMLPSMAEDEEFVSMFVDEAKIVGRLHHANIVPIYELGRIGESPFIAMEYVWGKDLLQIMNRFRKVRSYMPPPMAAFIASRLCEGLDYAHRRTGNDGKPLAIVHRDVSPQNVLCSYDGEVKLVDFGIATARSRLTRTQAGVLKGKFGYMSPEQARGEPLDRRSDVFAVGTCLWEMLTLERLFVAESDYHTLEKIRNVDILPPSKKNSAVPPELEKIVMRALSQNRETRWQWASDLADALQRYLVGCRPIWNANRLSAWLKENFAGEIGQERRKMAEEATAQGIALPARSGPPTIPPGARLRPPGAPSSPSIHEKKTAAPAPRPAAEAKPLSFSKPGEESLFDDVPEPAVEGTAVFYSNEAALLEAPILNIEGPPTPSGARMAPEPPPTPGRASMPLPPLPGLATPPPIPGVSTPPPIPPLATPIGSPRSSVPSGTVPFGVARASAPSTPRASAPIAPRRQTALFVAIGLGLTTLVFGGLFAWQTFGGGATAAPVARVFVSSAPEPSVDVRVDGAPVGRTPLVLDTLAPGHHVIEADSPAGPVRREIDLAAGAMQVVLLPVGAAPTTTGADAGPAAPPATGPPGRLSLAVSPERATVTLDGAPLPADRVGQEISLAAGAHRVVVTAEGFVEEDREVTIRPDTLESLRVELVPVRGRIVVESVPAGAEVTLDGRTRGRTPLRLEGLDFDRYRVGLSLDGYRSTRRRVVLTRDEPSADLRIELDAER